MNEIVIDASITNSFALPQQESHAPALALIVALAKTHTRLCAPVLWESEVDSYIRRLEYNKIITKESGNAALSAVKALEVEVIYLPSIRARALALGRQLNRARVYDCTYAALAQIRSCDFWTADKRFYNAAKSTFSWVKLLNEI